MTSRSICIRKVLSESELGREALQELSMPEPNGEILELVTAPIPPKVVWSVKRCLGDTGEEFGRRFGTSATVANYLCREGITDKALAALFRMVVLEGLIIPKEEISVPAHMVHELIEICGGTHELSTEAGISIQTVRSWVREGIPGVTGRWPQVFATALPSLFGGQA